MPLYSVPRRSFPPEGEQKPPVNWRRGLFRIWLLISAAWIMAWIIYLLMQGISGELKTTEDFLQLPVLLIGPPVALLIFGIAAGWAFRGFKVDDEPAKK
jgi:hypothetical protein